MKVTPQHVYEQTDGGKTIILEYYPQAKKSFEHRNFKFGIRNEKTPSAIVREYGGVWWVKDYGSSDKAMSPIDVVMKEESLDFSGAMKLIAEKFGIIGEDGQETKPRYEFRKGPADPEQEDGKAYPSTKDFTVPELKTIFSKNIWQYLSKKTKDGEMPSDEAAFRAAVAICKTYRLHSLEKYSWIKDRTAFTYISTESFPQFMFDEGSWQKYYKPREREKSKRFFSSGRKPENYMFGLAQAEKRLEEMAYPNGRETFDPETSEAKPNKPLVNKLPEIIICTGGSDALNIAALGFSVVWLNSETAMLDSSQFAKLRGLAERVYYLGDIDETGKKEALRLGMEYLDLHTIYLPDLLRQRYDLRGNYCKDVRDYFNYYSNKDFDNLLKQAYPLRFWDEEPKLDREGMPVRKFGRILYEYKPNNELIYNFLYRNGFGLMDMPNAKEGEVLVQVGGNVVRQIEFSHINRYVKDFLKDRYSPIDLLNAFHRSKYFSKDSMSNLNRIEVPFEDFGRDFQYLFFQNQSWRVSGDAIEVFDNEKCQVYVWEEEVIPHDVKVLPAPFTIKRDGMGDPDIEIHNTDCMFLRFLINASRVHWKKELEEELDKLPLKEQAEYREKYRWSIDGPLLSAEEIREQKQHLINKLVSFGYLLHRFKDPAAAYCIWAMDYAMQSTDDSNGGTGKSMAYMSLSQLMKHKLLSGRQQRLTDDPHFMEGTTEHTDLVLIDDANKYLDFDNFFSMINAFMPVNPKGMTAYTIPFSLSPKLCITSNYPPNKTDKSTMRRLWFTAFSDYYHKNPNGEYREERLPIHEFGKSLFTEFTAAEWNSYLNLMARCVQAWLTTGVVEPPMGNVMQNTYKAQMGPTFHAWADAYFNSEDQRLDRLVPRYMAQETYIKTLQPQLSAQGFMDKLKAFCRYNGYVLNPVELQGKDGRIMARHEKYINQRGEWVKSDKSASDEYLYIQTSAEITPERRFWDEPAGMPF
ncbi:toprim domain-containing protein [Arsenicibacter rosenii]|uniref:Toprim domain-containing protein n=1 Tax=Arsenicibacter rosenii TaxID=1750698 RepID=A0A1S2VTF9_9BACT|nr:toprim domain-containing protein [Arsenicibacter rosenii]OIN61198.1 hypothetical protein BLX24_03820 [Arsenicibacter rosenii]